MPLEADIARLSRVPLFSSFGPGALRLLAFAAESHPFKSGDYLFRQGEAADGGYLIVSGTIELLGVAPPGGERRLAAAGTLLGQHALLAEVPWPLSARAGKPSSTLKITRTMFLRVLGEYPADAVALRQIWAKRLHDRLVAE